MSITAYMVNAALRVAQEELLADEPIHLSPADFEAVVNLLESAPSATPELMHAMNRFQGEATR